jgi:hypothetical protein
LVVAYVDKDELLRVLGGGMNAREGMSRTQTAFAVDVWQLDYQQAGHDFNSTLRSHVACPLGPIKASGRDWGKVKAYARRSLRTDRSVHTYRLRP